MKFTEKEKTYLERKMNVDRTEGAIGKSFRLTNFNRLIGQMRGHNILTAEALSHGDHEIKSENPCKLGT